jgi:hypothetical protein
METLHQRRAAENGSALTSGSDHGTGRNLNKGGDPRVGMTAMRKLRKQKPSGDRPKLRQDATKAKLTTANTRFAEQTRKVLAKHYANKYRVR